MKTNYLSPAMIAFMASLASLTLTPVGDLHAADIFTRITTGPGSGTGNSRGGAWGDYDNDAFIDLFVPQIGPSGSDSANHLLYHNNTNGTFSRVTNGPVAQAFSASRGGAWADYDNDGYLDLVLVNEDQPNYLFHNNGDGSFAAVPSAVSADVANARGVTWVDYDNDGYVDIFRAGEDGPRLLYHNNHDGTFTGITGPGFLTVPGGFLGVAWGDYNNDGRPDLFLPSAGEPPINYLYRNDGGGTFARVGAGMMAGNGNQTGGGAWGDYDNDGDLDLFASCTVSHAQESRPNLFYRNDGNDTFTSLTSLPANDPESQGGASVGCTWGDYDNDGWLDLFVVNQGSQNDFLYHNNGDGMFTKVLDSVAVKDGATGLAAAWGDYDNDGFLDLFVGNFGGTHWLYHNNGNDNHWIKFRLIGTRSNRAAIGAKVRVRATINGQTFWQIREISGGDGVRGQNSLHVHVGLGNATNADLVRIEWPSGTVQELRGVAANQFLTVTELAVVPGQSFLFPGGSVTLSLISATGVPSTYQWQFNGTNLPGATNATLALSNVTTNQSGDYRAVITIGTEVVTLDPSTVRVFDRPTIITQPQSIDVPAGQILTSLSVVAMGPLPLTYQWQRNGTNLLGKTSRLLTFQGVQPAQEGDYTVIVSDANDSAVSQPATLRILLTPAFVQSPLSQNTVAGGSVTFSAQIAGNPPPFIYQWRKGTSFVASTLVANIESAERIAFLTLTNVQPADAGTYRLYLANAAAPTFDSASPNRTWALTTLADTDGDGLPDEWETANGLNLHDPSDALTDPDGDQMDNRTEYQSGTSPTNFASGLRLEAVTQANGKAAVTFQAVANQTYTVDWSARPGGSPWVKLADVLARSYNRLESVKDNNASDPDRFYRVVTPQRP